MNKVNNKSSTKSWKQQKKDFFAWVHSKPNTPTKAELRATQLFQQDQILQTFLPQVPVFINPQRKYVMDYFSMKYLCAIEIDGSYHNIQRQRHKDKVRRGKIGMLAGIKLWRITNNKILNSGLDTVEKLKLKIIKRQKSLAASQGKFEHIGQQLFLINRVLNKIDNKMFKLPRSIRWRSIERHRDKLPSWIGKNVGLPGATGKKISHLGGEQVNSYKKKRAGWGTASLG